MFSMQIFVPDQGYPAGLSGSNPGLAPSLR